jgi:hypothetical protein
VEAVKISVLGRRLRWPTANRRTKVLELHIYTEDLMRALFCVENAQGTRPPAFLAGLRIFLVYMGINVYYSRLHSLARGPVTRRPPSQEP